MHIARRPLSQSLWPSSLRPPNVSHHSSIAVIQCIRSYSARLPSSTYTYQISAAFSAKQHKLDVINNSFHLDLSHNLSSSISSDIELSSPRERRRKRWKSGQDAFFLSSVPQDGTIAFAVVDGVGGWVESGVDPADFAHRLCELMSAEAIATTKPVTGASTTPQDLLQTGYDLLSKDDSVNAGGSTACVGTVSANGEMEIANLGDSGFALFSPFRVSGLSSPQTHAFNTPYQLAKIPRQMRQQMEYFGSEHLVDLPRQSDIYKHTLSHGNVFILATDGVWDNLSPEDMLKTVSGIMLKASAWTLDSHGGHDASAIGSALLPQAKDGDVTRGLPDMADLSRLLATTLVREAKEYGWNTRRDGPFAKEVRRHFPMDPYRGGKQDDICVIAGLVIENGR